MISYDVLFLFFKYCYTFSVSPTKEKQEERCHKSETVQTLYREYIRESNIENYDI